ncbi:MAG: GDP-mannose 4,6-dehydratase [Lentilitoribacter sp.]
MSKNILITGITGQVGSQLAEYILNETEHNVIGMMRWQEPIENLYGLTQRINRNDRISIYYADLLDSASINKMFRETKPDFVSHLAAQSYPKTSFDIPFETLQTNIIGTANILENIRQIQEVDGSYSPAIHICSSSEVYGKAQVGVALTEETQFHGASPYSISKIGTDYLGQFYGEAYGLKTFITRMGTHSGPRRSDVFFESTVAKQIALIESGFQDPVVRVGNLSSTRTFQDARDAVRAYYLLLSACAEDKITPGECFNIAGEEIFKLTEVVDILLGMSTRDDIIVKTDDKRLRPIDADYQMFDNSKIKNTIDWKPEISAMKMFQDLLDHWRHEIKMGKIPLDR